MLCAAISGNKGECLLQILSPADLQALRGANQNARHSRPIGDRRYVLLVYQTAFEKTHYPMSLLPEISTPEISQPIISMPTQIESRLADRTEIHTIVKQLQVCTSNAESDLRCDVSGIPIEVSQKFLD